MEKQMPASAVKISDGARLANDYREQNVRVDHTRSAIYLRCL
jgi:hypothetical protein